MTRYVVDATICVTAEIEAPPLEAAPALALNAFGTADEPAPWDRLAPIHLNERVSVRGAFTARGTSSEVAPEELA